MKGIILDLEIPYFSTFRKPTSTSLILTFPVPPFTTVRGMLANALGLSRDDYLLQDKFLLGFCVPDPGSKNVEMAKILKLKSGMGKIVQDFPSSPMSREYIVQPTYRFYIAGENGEMEALSEALKKPRRPLYIGQSDDMVEYQFSKLIDVEACLAREFYSAVTELVPDAMMEKLPYKFRLNENGWEMESILLSIPNHCPVNTKEELPAYRFGEITVQLF